MTTENENGLKEYTGLMVQAREKENYQEALKLLNHLGKYKKIPSYT